jgi:hypothetical protein
LDLEALNLRLRPRGPYEAIDLGQALLRRNLREVYTAWAATVLPLGIAFAALAPVVEWLPIVLMWWFKPLYDRIVLVVLSRGVFGERVTVRDLPWRSIFDRSLWWSLTLGRFVATRSFMLPVTMLEGLDRARRRLRMRTLLKGARFPATLLTTAFLYAEQALALGYLPLVVLLAPQGVDVPVWRWLTDESMPLWLSMVGDVSYLMALTLLEPLYVACGFTLYLNRRVELEAWDIELDLRQQLKGDGPDRREAA